VISHFAGSTRAFLQQTFTYLRARVKPAFIPDLLIVKALWSQWEVKGPNN
jgi:hypothetical protein